MFSFLDTALMVIRPPSFNITFKNPIFLIDVSRHVTHRIAITSVNTLMRSVGLWSKSSLKRGPDQTMKLTRSGLLFFSLQTTKKYRNRPKFFETILKTGLDLFKSTYLRSNWTGILIERETKNKPIDRDRRLVLNKTTNRLYTPMAMKYYVRDNDTPGIQYRNIKTINFENSSTKSCLEIITDITSGSYIIVDIF